MASGPALSTAQSEIREINVGTEITDFLPLLDVLSENQFEGQSFDPELAEQTEENFYRGAPPTWLNFHISEQAESDGTGTPFIKRDGYDALVTQIEEQRKFPGISSVKLFHQTGCGGTTLAMQVLWGLRKTFRCAVLTGSTSDITTVADEVVHLFTAGSRGRQNTVLLLVNDEEISEKLQDSIMTKLAELKIAARMPVVILLNCVRASDDFIQRKERKGNERKYVILKRELSGTEKQKLDEKKEELSRKYGDKCKQFHGFNIMQTGFSQAYIQEACAVCKTIKKNKRPRNAQLAAFLSLLNAYVPGSYLLESQCLDFFKPKDNIHGDLPLEDRMKPFSHLIITFQQDTRSERKVCMAHPMIAQCCTDLMAEAGVTRSDTARNFLTCLCRDEAPLFLLGFVKDMLTKRETIKEENPVNGAEERQEKFSRLILNIQKMEDKTQSASVLEKATKIFDKNPFYPQALAHFCYLELKDYNRAEKWAETAKQRDPNNSFVADTLGQVHKHHLEKKTPDTPREILQLATKAINAFKHEEQLAENENAADMKEDGKTKFTSVFNTRGQLGYLQVCNLVYDRLVDQNKTWREVLKRNKSMDSVLKFLKDNKLDRFKDLINSLRDEVEKKYEFCFKYLTYSKPHLMRDDPSYFSNEISKCYQKYVGDSPTEQAKQKGADFVQKLKQKLAGTTAGGLSCLDREYTQSELEEINTWGEEIFLRSLCTYSSPALQMPLSPKLAPELHLLTLLLYWPTDSEDKCVFDLSQLIQHMHSSYERAYKSYFRSRYLPPLFFMGRGQGLNRIVLRKVLEGLFLGQKSETGWSYTEKIFQDPKIQEHLLRFEGEVRNYRVFATIGGTEIEVDADQRNSVWKPRQVSFYLGFTISGPAAFGIQTRSSTEGTENGKSAKMASGPALSTAQSEIREINVGTEITDFLPLLDVLSENQFEGQSFDPELAEQTEENFYRGAPPTWLNFHISEQAESDGTGTPFIKRDGYDALVTQIEEQRKFPGISSVKLFHQTGCGGTTLAMQVLWGLRKTFRCAVLTGSTSDITTVADEVVHLFTAGSRDGQNTVLLLVNDEDISENLQDSIMTKLAELKIAARMPVVILLNCVRASDDFIQRKERKGNEREYVILKRELSGTEKQKLDEKKEELSRKYSGKCKQFHGFNIMQTGFSQAYIKEACAVCKTIKKPNTPQNAQLAAFLSLLNAYVPGSYLLESQCLDFFKPKDNIHGDLPLEDRMKPFSHLIITFQQDTRSERKVCMAHPMIAQCCTDLMAEAGVTRSDTARNFLTCLCRDEAPPFLLGFVKDMLTKRETIKEENPVNGAEERQEKFSRLILNIQKMEDKTQSASILEKATKIFDKNPFYPQALARFCYLELKDYNKAEKWAETAKQRHPNNSFVADTLGQVHKHHLDKKTADTPREILQLATKAINAFKHEEQLAENENAADMKEDGKTKFTSVFNTRGLLGYLQVCNLVYDRLVAKTETWREVLTRNKPMGSVLKLLGDNKLDRFKGLINSLRDEVEKKYEFLLKYLTYSKPHLMRDDPSYFSNEISKCYQKYVGDSSTEQAKQKGTDFIQKLKQKLAGTTAGGLSCLDREYTQSELEEINTWGEEIFLRSLCTYSSPALQMPLSPKLAPELLLLTLLLYWPTDSEDKCVFDLSQLIQHMHSSYERAYKSYFRSRYLPPLFFMGRGQGLNRIVRRKVLEGLFLGQKSETGWSYTEKIFKDPKIQERLLRFEGEVRNYRVFATIGGTEIEVDANQRNSVWKPRQVSFYLGFTIRGPVAFDIETMEKH